MLKSNKKKFTTTQIYCI